jgi:DNA primase
MDRQKLIEILNSYNVLYWTEGKNVSPGWINITCPYCADPSNHCGISPESVMFHCWRCSEKGTLYKLLSQLTHINKKEYNLLISEHTVQFKDKPVDQIKALIEKSKNTSEKSETEKVKLPKFIEPITIKTRSALLNAYLKKRKLGIQTCIDHNCYLGKAGDFTNRMIIPVIRNKELVGFVGADLTGTSTKKYKNEGKINNTLYNFDKFEYECEKIIVTEGILDCWRVGEFGTCTFGTHVSEQQKMEIITKKPKQLVFAWDGDAWSKSIPQAQFFIPFIDCIKIVIFPKDEDPDSYILKYGYAKYKLLEDNSLTWRKPNGSEIYS